MGVQTANFWLAKFRLKENVRTFANRNGGQAPFCQRIVGNFPRWQKSSTRFSPTFLRRDTFLRKIANAGLANFLRVFVPDFYARPLFSARMPFNLLQSLGTMIQAQWHTPNWVIHPKARDFVSRSVHFIFRCMGWTPVGLFHRRFQTRSQSIGATTLKHHFDTF